MVVMLYVLIFYSWSPMVFLRVKLKQLCDQSRLILLFYSPYIYAPPYLYTFMRFNLYSLIESTSTGTSTYLYIQFKTVLSHHQWECNFSKPAQGLSLFYSSWFGHSLKN